MAEAQQSLLKNSSSIGNIQESLNAFGSSLRKANSTSSSIVKSLYEGNRDKKRAIIKQRELFQKEEKRFKEESKKILLKQVKQVQYTEEHQKLYQEAPKDSLVELWILLDP